MKRFLTRVLTIVFVFVIAALCIEYYQSKVVNNMYTYKCEFMDHLSASVKTLILGNSYMENSFNPKLLGDSIFDLAIEGRWIYYDDRLLEKYIEKMPNLQQVIFGMGYAIPFCRSYHFPEESRDYANYQKYKYEKFMRIRYDKVPYYYWLGFWKGYIRMKTLSNNKSEQKIVFDNCGYSSFGEKEDEENWRNMQNIDSNIIDNPHAKQQILEYSGYLKNMARLCQQHNIRFIVITPPCHDSYNANVRQEGIDILHGMIEEIRVDYPVEYIDYLQDKGFRADSIYYNCSHLNSIGADMFALRVKKDFGL